MGGDVPSNTTSTQTTVNQPPAYLQPYITQIANRASDLSNRPYNPYGGEQVAPLNAYHQQGIGIAQQRALNGSPYLTAAQNQAANTLNGAYQGQNFANGLAGVNNPYLNNVIQNTNSDIVRKFQDSQMPQTDASFARSGAFGGSAWQQANAENNRQMASELIKNESNLRMQDYATQQQLAENQAERNQSAWNAERARQVGAITPAQQLSNQPYTDAMQLLGIGDVQRDYQQTYDNQLYQNYLNAQNWPLQNLDILQNGVRSAMGGGGTSVQTATLPQINRTASMLGGGLAGATLANGLASGSQNSGAYTALGAGLGALGGYLGG